MTFILVVVIAAALVIGLLATASHNLRRARHAEVVALASWAIVGFTSHATSAPTLTLALYGLGLVLVSELARIRGTIDVYSVGDRWEQGLELDNRQDPTWVTATSRWAAVRMWRAPAIGIASLWAVSLYTLPAASPLFFVAAVWVTVAGFYAQGIHAAWDDLLDPFADEANDLAEAGDDDL